MSVKQMSMVWELDLHPNQKIVLLAYADHADEDGDRVYPSLGRVAHKTGYSVQQVRRLSRQLVEAGLMERVEEGHGRGHTHRYRLTLEKGIKLQPFKPKAERVSNGTEKVTSEQEKVSPMVPEPSIEPSENHTLEGTPAAPDISANEFVSFLAEELKCAYAPLQKGRKDRYGKEFKEHLAKGVTRSVLFKAADRIVERWVSDDHRKLTLEQALEDVVNGKPPRHAQKKLTLVKPEDQWKEGYHQHYEDYTTSTAEERRARARQLLSEA